MGSAGGGTVNEKHVDGPRRFIARAACNLCASDSAAERGYRYKKKRIFQRFRSRPDSDIPRSGQPKLNIPPAIFCTFARMQAARLPVVSPSHTNHAPTRQHTTVAKQVSPVPAPLAPPSLARPSRSAPTQTYLTLHNTNCGSNKSPQSLFHCLQPHMRRYEKPRVAV